MNKAIEEYDIEFCYDLMKAKDSSVKLKQSNFRFFWLILTFNFKNHSLEIINLVQDKFTDLLNKFEDVD